MISDKIIMLFCVVLRDTGKCLNLTYKLDDCHTGTWNHKLEVGVAWKNTKGIKCSKLHPLLPFVKRGQTKDGCMETLVQGDKVLGQHLFHNVTC